VMLNRSCSTDPTGPGRAAVKAGPALDLSFTIRRLLVTQSSDNPSYLAGRERVCAGMRLAGVPEG
jgi:hypothetical protein